MIVVITTFLVLFNIAHGNILSQVFPTKNNDDINAVPRIIGGVEAPEGYAKHMVALVVGTTIKMLSCGGSIVTRRHVLSAAHCIEPYVIWGELMPYIFGVTGSNSWKSTEHVVKFSGHVTHPDFSWISIKNDIGVLVTSEDIMYTDRIQPISLNWNWIPGGRTAFATGWGFTTAGIGVIPERLQLLHVKTISPLTCILGVRNASSDWESNPPRVDPFQEICTFHSTGHGMCNGDSGSALVLQQTQDQVGIVSWGFPCAIGAPDVFVRISAFKNFLIPIIGSHLYD